MHTWPSILLGLAALFCPTGGEDGHVSDHEDRSFSVTTVRRGDDDRRQLSTSSEFSEACSTVRKRSLKACDKCLSNEMCPYIASSNTYYVCSPMTKRCADPAWSATEISNQCGVEKPQDYATWGAQCMLVCEHQSAPFACASKCLNEDFPCRWIDGCHASSGNLKGMFADSPSCLRPCQDHDSMLQVELKTIKNMATHIDTCTQATSYYGCSNKFGANILELCPHTCRTGECAWRCGRDELPHNGQQCWQLVEKPVGGISCAKAISLGMDCHCKCASAYLGLARSGGGAFHASLSVSDESVGLNISVVANESFDISLTGQAMRTDKVNDMWGPRLKVVVKGQDCRYARLMAGLTGLSCVAPMAGSASATTASICVTPPTSHSPYVHKWDGLKIGHCGQFDVCHCNYKCDLTRSWVRAGTVTVEPPVEVGGISKAMPGCERALPQLAPVKTGPIGEQYLTTLTSITLKIFGGIKQEHNKFAKHASKQALVSILKAYSGLLDREVPIPNDVDVQMARRLESDDAFLENAEMVKQQYLRYSHSVSDLRRMASGCADNNTAFEEEAAKANVFFKTCAEALQAEAGTCTEASLQTAVGRGCQRTCALCAELTTSTTTGGPTMPPDVQALGSLSFAFDVTGHTDWSGANILARLNQLKQDTVPYTQRLFVELEAALVPLPDIPDRLWVSVVTGPTQKVIPKEDTPDEKDDSTDGPSILLVVLGSAIGGSVCLGLIFVCVGYACGRWRKKNTKVEPAPVKEVTQVSEGGYRLKKMQVEEPGEPVEDVDCFEKCLLRCYAKSFPCCLRCYKRCCTKKLKKAKAWSEVSEAPVADPSQLIEGTTVKLFGLTSAHYNGLIGTIISGPNEKGRYEVDLLVVNDYSTEEHQTLSFKSSNMRVIPQVEDDAEVTSPEPSPVAAQPKPDPMSGLKGSYRTSKT